MKQLPTICMATLFALLMLGCFKLDASANTPFDIWVMAVNEKLAAQGARISTLELRVKELEGKQPASSPGLFHNAPIIGNHCIITPYHYK